MGCNNGMGGSGGNCPLTMARSAPDSIVAGPWTASAVFFLSEIVPGGATSRLSR